MVNQIWFVDASVFLVFRRGKDRAHLVHPTLSIPFQKANRVRPPKILRRSRIVDALPPLAFATVPPPDVARAPLPSHSWLRLRPATGKGSRVLRLIFQPVAESGAPEGSDALYKSVAPDPCAWPARYIHHCSPRCATLASTISAPPEPVEVSRGSKIFVSVPGSSLVELLIFLF